MLGLKNEPEGVQEIDWERYLNEECVGKLLGAKSGFTAFETSAL